MKNRARGKTHFLLVALVIFLMGGLTALAAGTAPGLGTAGDFAILAGSTITNTGATVITGDLGLSPGTAVTGFPPGIVNGVQHVTDATALQAQSDLVTAYNQAAGQTPVSTIATELGGTTRNPGIYDSAAGTFQITGTLTLDAQGDPNAIFIFKSASTFITAVSSSVLLINGAQPCRVFWQVGSSATLGVNSSLKGNILAFTSVTLNSGAQVEGRVLARNGAVTLDSNTVTKATCFSLGSGTLTGTVVGTTTAATTTSGTLTGTVIATTTAATSTSGTLTGTVVAPASSSAGSGSSGGSAGGSISPPSVASIGSGGGIITATVTPPSVGAVLGASTSVPFLPNTGGGGDVATTLLGSLVIAMSGVLYLRRKIRT